MGVKYLGGCMWGRVFLSVFLSVISLPVAVAVAGPLPLEIPKLERMGSLETDIFANPAPGRLVFKISQGAQILGWDEATRSLESLYRPDMAGAYSTAFSSLKYATSPSGKYLFIKELRSVAPFTPQLRILDLFAKKSWVEEESRLTGELPAVSQDDSKYVFFGSQDPNGHSAWTFPLGEFLFDLENEKAQPSGFYTEPISRVSYGPVVKSSSLSPDGRYAVLVVGGYSNYTRSLDDDDEYSGRPVYVPYRGGPQGASKETRILDVKTGKHEEILKGRSMESVIWMTDDTLVLKEERGFKAGSLYKYTISTKKAEILSKDWSSSEEPSSDGRWLLYAPVPSAGSAPRSNLIVPGRIASPTVAIRNPYDSGTIALVDLETLRQYKFENVSSAVFASDVQSMVFRLRGENGDKPFAQVSLKSYIDGVAPQSLDLKKESAAVTRMGTSIPRYKIPKDPKLFAEHFELVDPQIFPMRVGLVFQASIRNKSRKFFGVDDAQPFEISSELIDETGKVLANYKFLGRRTAPGTVQSFAPGEVRRVANSLVSKTPYPPTAKLKVRYYWEGAEKTFSGEIEVP